MREGRKGISFIIIAVCFVAVFLAIYSFIDARPPENTDDIQFLVGVSQPNLNEPWRVVMNKEIKAEAGKYPELRVIFTDAAQSSNQQKSDIEKLMHYGIDLLIVSLDDPAALTPIVTKVYKKIPVIVLGRGVTGYDYTLYIGSDNERIGKKVGKYVYELLGNKGGKIVEVQGVRQSPTVMERNEGFLEVLSSHPNIQRTDVIFAAWQRDQAEDKILNLLKNGDEPDVVLAHNDAMAVGAHRALQKLKMTNTKVIGIDAVNAENGGLHLIRTGEIAGTITSPTGGKEAVQYALDILRKEKGIPKKIMLRSQKITKENVDAYLAEQREREREVMHAAQPKEKITLGFAQVGSESGWRLANTKSIIAAADEAGIHLIFENAKQSQERQIEIIRSFIRQDVDVIAFSPKVETGWDEVLEEAKQAGIPVILSDREVRVEDDSLWTAYIGSDFEEEGRRAARWLVANEKADTPMQVIEIQGTAQSAPAVGRNEGFTEVLAQYPGFQIIDSFEGDYTLETGRKLMEKALRKYGSNIDVVYAHNDDMALGAIKAIEKFGLAPGKDIIMISVDATKSAFRAMSAGKLNLAVECNPILGPQIIKAVKDIMAGKEIPMKFITSEGVFPQEVAREVMPKREY